MKAWKLNGIGDIQYDKDVPEPKFAANEALVRVKAAGICGSDVQRVYVNGAHQMPLIIGHEFSGVVTAIGDKVSEKWVGKRVGIFPLIPCR
ncbi:MAG: alcohol dehydrogenase catalytic domain-containing protein, partial [Epulopiscium sp.]|nr:alcohol dehydrogenase catalytic domain-containing protein [Candidatus Epulonipiscium sp.]